MASRFVCIRGHAVSAKRPILIFLKHLFLCRLRVWASLLDDVLGPCCASVGWFELGSYGTSPVLLGRPVLEISVALTNDSDSSFSQKSDSCKFLTDTEYMVFPCFFFLNSWAPSRIISVFFFFTCWDEIKTSRRQNAKKKISQMSKIQNSNSLLPVPSPPRSPSSRPQVTSKRDLSRITITEIHQMLTSEFWKASGVHTRKYNTRITGYSVQHLRRWQVDLGHNANTL